MARSGWPNTSARGAVFPSPTGRLDDEGTYEAFRRFGDMTRDSAEGVADLGYRTGLLEGVQAFGTAHMSKNRWITNGNYLPFDIFVGELKGVSPYYRGHDGCGFTLHSPGLWRVDALVKCGTHEIAFTGPHWCDLDIILYLPNGEEYGRKRFHTVPSEGTEETLGGTHPFVAPEPGCHVIAYGNSGRWRKFHGGALNSTLAVTKYGHEISALPPQTVPDSERP